MDESEAIKRIYEIKDRICTKPLSVCVSHLGEIENIADTTRVSRLLTSFFPGPVTLLLKRNPKLNPELNPGLDTIGIRIPDNNFIRAVCEEVGPLALTSANKSGGGDSTLVEDFKDLHPLLDCIFDVGVLRVPVGLDGEPKTHSLGSTVIDVTKPGKYKMIREGCSARRYINLLHRFGYRKGLVVVIFGEFRCIGVCLAYEDRIYIYRICNVVIECCNNIYRV